MKLFNMIIRGYSAKIWPINIINEILGKNGNRIIENNNLRLFYWNILINEVNVFRIPLTDTKLLLNIRNKFIIKMEIELSMEWFFLFIHSNRKS